MDEIPSFGAWLRRRRKALALTQVALARRMGYSVSTIRKLEADEYRPSREIAEHLADALGIAPEERAAFVHFARVGLDAEGTSVRLPAAAPPTPAAAVSAPAEGAAQPVPEGAARALPTGTVTFLFTDIEGSTRLWEQQPQAMPTALARHDAILRAAIAERAGVVFRTEGDAVCAAFARALDAFMATLEAQQTLHAEPWGPTGPIRVRMALHTGVVEVAGDDYQGLTLSRIARLLAAGYGGQILLSRATHELVREHLSPDVALRDLGAHWLRDLTHPEHIFQVVAPALPVEFPPLRTLSTRPHNLPPQPTLFIGREAELALIATQLHNPACRLVTVIGPGGIGKTRLALEAAAAQRPDFPDGVYVVPLAAISSSRLLVSTIADVLGLARYGETDAEAQLLAFLRERSALLVLDNFEHLIEGTRLLAQILDQAPGVKLLVTSRERLNLLEEWLIPLQGLPFPRDDGATDAVATYSAVQLFVQRAAQVQPGFGLTAAVQPAVLRICRLVEGLPLGIELAAAWARLLPCAEIAGEIGKNLDLLATSARNVPARQRSLRAAFEHSWALLADDERQVFARLAVFCGGFRREAAEAVTGASLALLSALVDKSLLQAHQSGRYYVHETLRQYAAEKLAALAGASDQAHDRHCGYYLALLQHILQDELVGRLKEVLAQIDEDLENVRAAWIWAVAYDKFDEIAISMLGLFRFYETRNLFREGVEAFAWVVDMLRRKGQGTKPGVGSETQTAVITADALTLEGWFYLHLGLFDIASDRVQESAALLRSTSDQPAIAENLLLLGTIVAIRGPYEEAKQPLWECIAITRETGKRTTTAFALLGLGIACTALGEYAEARQHLRESLAIHKALGHQWGIGFCLQHLGDVARALEENAEAHQRYQESLAVRAEIDDRWGMATALVRLGSLARMVGAYGEAQRRYQESLAIYRAMSHSLGMATALGNLGQVAFAQGSYAEAKQLHQESLALSRETGNKRAIAISLNHLGRVTCASGEYRESRHAFDEALTTALEIGMIPLALEVLVELAALVAQERAAERAIELLALALQHPAGTRRTRDRAGRLLAELATGLPPEVVAAAQERGRQRDLWATGQELLEELEAAGWSAAQGAMLTPPAP